MLPYAPVLDLLRTYLGTPPSAEVLRSWPPSLTQLLPELETSSPETPAAPRLDPQQEQARRFQALLQFLLQQGTPPGPPLLIVIEDLHWADDSSLEFLLHVGRRLPTQRVWMLLTYRNDEMHPALQHFLAEFEHARLATELTLARLSSAEVEAMIRAIFEPPGPVREEFVTAVHSRTDGNPFFIEETLKSLVAAGDIYYANGAWTRKPLGELGIPRTVNDAVQRRTRQLSERGGQLLTLAAVAGRRFDLRLLQAVTQQSEEELLRSVKELMAAQLVHEESADQFAFRHELTRQAVVAGLLARERRSLHGQLLQAMEALYGTALGAHLNDLAYHAHAAEAWDRALEYSRQAGEQAQALYTPGPALEHFTHALEAARELGQTASASLLRARAQMHQTLGDFEDARQDYQAGLEIGQTRSDPQAQWHALVDLGFLWVARDYGRAGQYFRQALDLAPGLDDPATLAQTLNRMGNWYANIEQPDEALRCHRQALQIFESCNDQRSQAETLDLLGISSFIANDLVQGAAYYARAIALFRDLGDRGGLLSSLTMNAVRSVDYLGRTAVPALASIEVSVREGQEAWQIAREIGARPAEAITQSWLALIYASGGDYAQALAWALRGLAVAEAIEHLQFMTVAHLVLGAVYLDLLALPEARQHLEQALPLARQNGSSVWVGAATGFLISTCVAQKQLSPAEAALQAVFTPDLPTQAMGQRQVWFGAAELALARGDARQALQIVERLIASAPNVASRGEQAIPQLALLRGRALAALGRMKEAEKVLLSAQDIVQAARMAPLLWRLDVALGQTYLAWGKRDDAAGALASARSVIETLAAQMAETDVALRDRFLHAATAALGRVSLDSPRRQAKTASGGLTRRERDVAVLIARGQSNRQIAAALTLSPRTVEVHIANILSKLGADSRSQIAVWVVEHKI